MLGDYTWVCLVFFCLSVKCRHWFNTFPFHLHSQDVVNSDGPAGLPSVKNFCADSEPSPILTAPVPLLAVLEVSTESFSPGYPATRPTHLCLQKNQSLGTDTPGSWFSTSSLSHIRFSCSKHLHLRGAMADSHKLL